MFVVRMTTKMPFFIEHFDKTIDGPRHHRLTLTIKDSFKDEAELTDCSNIEFIADRFIAIEAAINMFNLKDDENCYDKALDIIGCLGVLKESESKFERYEIVNKLKQGIEIKLDFLEDDPVCWVILDNAENLFEKKGAN